MCKIHTLRHICMAFRCADDGAEFQRMAHRALEQLGDAAKLCLERDVGAACQPFLQQAVEGVAADVADELAVLLAVVQIAEFCSI